MTDWITTKQAMKLLGVGSTTIKRWADENKLPFIRTAGGHRRFKLTDVEYLLGQQSAFAREDILSIDTWVKRLTNKSDAVLIRDEIVKLHSQLGDWFKVADYLGEVTQQIGLCWANNEISILEEHVASGLLDLAVSAITTSIRIPATAPVCLMATLSGEQHTLGLSLVRLCLRSSGLQTFWAGADTPVKELITEINHSKPPLLALSASSWSTDFGSLANAYRAIVAACQQNGTELILGGAGAWPDISNYGYRCQTFAELRMILERLNLIN